MVAKLADMYNMLWKMVIRPPRDVYTMEELGPPKFRLGKEIFERHDLQLKSKRGVLQCSHFVPTKDSAKARPCVVYLHGNCSSRLEAFDALPVLLPRGLSVFCLDLSGSGRSDGEYVSLGHFEEIDLQAVLEHLRSKSSVSSIGLWGRSMGATTSIFRAAEDKNLAGCVLDSGFSDLRTVAEELVNRGRFWVPSMMVSMVFDLIRTEVMSRADFDPMTLVPLHGAKQAGCPAFFGVALDDSFVLPHHTHYLYKAWGGERVLRVFDGGHNGVRPQWFLEEAADFLAACLKKKAREASLGGEASLEGKPMEVCQEATTASSDESWSNEEEHGGAAVQAAQAVSRASEHSSSTTPMVPAERRPSDAETLPSPMAATELEASRRPQVIREKLIQMGFRSEQIGDVAAKSASVDDALETIMRRHDVLCRLQNLPPSGRHAPAASGFPAPQAVQSEENLETVVPEGSLEEQLCFLGFDQVQSRNAAQRCCNLDAAADWLADNNATVAL
eukprot:TRINITY_DN8778_c0_g4_i1.p1 TRINITY_DN8778_c0_g4~~TRINITY_DN8778_c0_g4_i1.p1  ORF type:complete len:502 (+),score=146.55 TRINITY_DN8778_c0_g4_i1:129-1634(+)